MSQIERLKAGAHVWNTWREEAPNTIIELREADLREADLRGADLREADLHRADLHRANLREANLREADLRGADLREADLRRANLREADLRGADLRGAGLRGAGLKGIAWNHLTTGIAPAPGGVLQGWKKGANGEIIELEIPREARRSCATTRKFRAEFAKVINAPEKSYTLYDGIRMDYNIGEMVYPDYWDENRWNECSHGIHFFLTREEAEAW